MGGQSDNKSAKPEKTWEDILAEYEASLFSKYDSFYLYLKEYYNVPVKKDQSS